jgi:hypothetical protein
MSDDRRDWIYRAALAAVHTLTSSNMGYHPDTRETEYDEPLDVEELVFLHAIHRYCSSRGIDIATETMEVGIWMIFIQRDDIGATCELFPASGFVFSKDAATYLMLELRQAYCQAHDMEPNEGNNTVEAGDYDWCSATGEDGTNVKWHRILLFVPGIYRATDATDVW